MLLFRYTCSRSWEWDRGAEIKKGRARLAGLPYQSPFTASIQWPNSCRLVHDIFAPEVVHEITAGTSTKSQNSALLVGICLRFLFWWTSLIWFVYYHISQFLATKFRQIKLNQNQANFFGGQKYCLVRQTISLIAKPKLLVASDFWPISG